MKKITEEQFENLANTLFKGGYSRKPKSLCIVGYVDRLGTRCNEMIVEVYSPSFEEIHAKVHVYNENEISEEEAQGFIQGFICASLPGIRLKSDDDGVMCFDFEEEVEDEP